MNYSVILKMIVDIKRILEANGINPLDCWFYHLLRIKSNEIQIQEGQVEEAKVMTETITKQFIERFAEGKEHHFHA